MLIHHGDIWMRLVDTTPNGHEVKQSGSLIVGLGEQSGHMHIIEQADLLAAHDVTMEMLADFAATGEPLPGHVYVNVKEQTAIRHLKDNQPTGEHADIALEPGLWVVWRPREYTPEAIRRVID